MDFLNKAVDAVNKQSSSRNDDRREERYDDRRDDRDNYGSSNQKSGGLKDAVSDLAGTILGGGEAKKREEEERRRQEEERRRQEEANKNPVERLVGGLLGGSKRDERQEKEEGGFLGKIGNSFEEKLGGGKKAEQNEDILDKGESTYLDT